MRPRAIGRIRPNGPWIGFLAADGGHRLVVEASATPEGTRAREADADVLLALAIAYFEEAFDDAPPEVEATHEDLSELVREVAASEEDPHRQRLLAEAVDAIDDGLPGDAVAGRLAAARNLQERNEQADPVDLLVTLAEDLLLD